MNNLLCPVCSESEEKLSHVAACSSNLFIKVCKIKSYHDIYGSDIFILKKWARFLSKYDNLRNYMLNLAKVCVHWEKIILSFQVAFNYISFSKC